ncbi:hypothetical protein BV22DRAFT_1038818 [Leucogyrophana mollusca]|uniref:Uncharacterized protein n=1 Tax=Leucogyrophana mollusca TaxID=85980 RepID=A0ACB8B691_9AGAM|nr:hypothetical protein BV22DRAFT_1038818 [Leucogyrophana mollusca]
MNSVVPGEEPEELVRFREAWRAEVKQRRGVHPEPKPQTAVSPPNETTAPTSVSVTKTDHGVGIVRGGPNLHPGPSSHTIAGAPTVPVHASHGQSRLSPAFGRAIEVYRSAVNHEQRSQLDEALRLYRQAFRLDPNVDRAYHKEEQRLEQLALETAAARKKPASGAAPPGAVDGLAQGVEALSIHHGTREIGTVTGTLANVLAGFPQELIFEPEDEKEGTPIKIIPDELLLHILRSLDTTTIERFATVNRKARVLSLDSAIWRDFVHLAYKPPQIPDEDAISTIVDQYRADYRRVYIEHPRLRMDGIYIAVCHYVRTGLSENAWVNISHLITYHRYLRFFPDGKVLSLLANEEHQPQQVIPMLKPTLRMKGFYIGDWHLDGTTVHLTNLAEMHDKVTTNTNVAPPEARYVFQMTLALRSRPVGRWNRLDFIGYDSVEIETGEAVPLPLKHERSFWFSKVRSYPAY